VIERPELDLPHIDPTSEEELKENKEVKLAYEQNMHHYHEAVYHVALRKTIDHFTSNDVQFARQELWNQLRPQGQQELLQNVVNRLGEAREHFNYFADLKFGNILNNPKKMGTPPPEMPIMV